MIVFREPPKVQGRLNWALLWSLGICLEFWVVIGTFVLYLAR